MPSSITFAGAVMLSCAFALARFLRKLTLRIRRRWEALSAGVAVAYVFVNIMPELEEHRPVVAETARALLIDAEKRIYLWALLGFIAFAGLSRLRYFSEQRMRTDSVAVVFGGKMAGFAVYTLLVRYLLAHREDASLLSLELFVFAMGLHLFMVDNELADEFEDHYERLGRPCWPPARCWDGRWA